MNKRHIKLIMELIFIFILPLLFIGFTSEIQVEREFTYDNNGNYETSQDTKQLTYDNSIIKYTNGYKNIIENFNLLQNYKYGYYYIIDDVLYNSLGTGTSTISNIPPIEVNNGDQLYIYYNGPSPLYIKIWITDNNQNKLDYQVKDGNEIITINNNGLLYFTIEYNSNININNVKVGINYSVSWANGNYVPYGKPLIIYSDNDISEQNNINYTIWGNIKQLLIDNLDLNDNVLLDIVLCYTILWFIMWILWHLFYGFLELLIHVIPRKWESDY